DVDVVTVCAVDRGPIERRVAVDIDGAVGRGDQRGARHGGRGEADVRREPEVVELRVNAAVEQLLRRQVVRDVAGGLRLAAVDDVAGAERGADGEVVGLRVRHR